MNTRRRQPVLIVTGFLIVGLVVLVGVFRSTEPVYRGAPLSLWLDGTMSRRGVPWQEQREVWDSVGPEALPWLVRFVGLQEGMADRKYHEWYYKQPPSQQPSYLPKPRLWQKRTARYNAAQILARLAPGTEYEDRALDSLLPSGFRDRDAPVWFHLLGSFTNSGERVVPVLITGLTNPVTFEASLGSLEKFGTAGSPRLLEMALKESGFVRPAELALEKIDPERYQELLRVRFNAAP
ncbi:MAG TPA: hypothetical protein VMS21_00525 [Methylomirabilota bacterium]|nr:hypothetical protein [Methylomirabilota bacterium]